MIYGTNSINLARDVTDLIGIRTLILRQYWTVATESPSWADVDAAKPSAPRVSSGMLIMGEQTVKEKGRYATFWTYQGINGDGKSVTFKDRNESLDYGFDPGFAQVPIQVHKNFEALLAKYQGYPSNDGTTVIWPPNLSESTGGSLDKDASPASTLNPMFGIQAFFEMEGVYRFRYAARDLPSDLERGVGYIADSLPGKAPSLADGRNWLKAPTAYERKGYIFDITEFYWMSRRGGWPDPVYGKGSGGLSGLLGLTNASAASLGSGGVGLTGASPASL